MRFGVTAAGERREYAGMHFFEAAWHYQMNQRTNSLDTTPAGAGAGTAAGNGNGIAGLPLLAPNGFCPSDKLVHSGAGGTGEGTVWRDEYDAVWEAAGYGNTSVRQQVTTQV